MSIQNLHFFLCQFHVFISREMCVYFTYLIFLTILVDSIHLQSFLFLKMILLSFLILVIQSLLFQFCSIYFKSSYICYFSKKQILLIFSYCFILYLIFNLICIVSYFFSLGRVQFALFFYCVKLKNPVIDIFLCYKYKTQSYKFSF